MKIVIRPTVSFASFRAVSLAALASFSGIRTAGAVDAPGDRDHAKPCRPTIACTADIVVPGELEVEGGGSYAHGGAVRQWSFPFLLKLSVTTWLQVQVGSNGYTLVRSEPHGDYFDNLLVGPKFHLLDQQKFVPSLALSAQVSVPTFAADGYTRSTDLFFVGYASKDIGPIHLDWNVGLDLWRSNDGARAQGFTALVVSTALPANFGVEGEGYIFSAAGTAASRDLGVRGALTYSARPWLVFDAAGDAGFYPSNRAYSVFAGVTIIPVVFWRPTKSG